VNANVDILHEKKFNSEIYLYKRYMDIWIKDIPCYFFSSSFRSGALLSSPRHGTRTHALSLATAPVAVVQFVAFI